MDASPAIPDFQLIRRIGAGSYGDVWLARSITGVYRAIKIVNRARFEDSRPFLREFEGIRRFQHAVGSQPRQLALLHVGCDELAGVLYYVMELADDAEAGTDIDPATYVPLTLKELRRRRAEPLPIVECVAIGVSLANALSGLHEKGLIHRDVKPSNIIFVSGVPKLADVGLVASSEQTLTSLGTPGYAPPEGVGNAQGDLYSLGKILYELATGLGPEKFPRVPKTLLSGGNGALFLELNEVILRACDPMPARRYPDAPALSDDLHLLQAGRSVQELNRNRRRLRLLTRFALMGGVLSLVIIAVLGAKNYVSLQRLAAREIALRQLAEADDRAARYTSDLHLAQQGFAANDFGGTRVALRRQLPQPGQPDLRGFEWFALWNETAGDQIAMGGAIGGPAVSTLALSPDGQQLAVQEGEGSRTTVLWDLPRGERTLVSNETYGFSGFSDDGSHLIVGTASGHVFEYEIRTHLRQPIQKIDGWIHQELPDGHTLLLSEARANDFRLMVWDSQTQQQIADWTPEHQPYNINLSAAAVSRDHRLLAASIFGGEGTLRQRDLVVYDLVEKTARFHLHDIDRVQSIRFAPDGRSLAIAMANQPIRIISSTTGETQQQLRGANGVVHAVDFSPDGHLLASVGADRILRVWDVETGESRKNFFGHEADVISLAWFGDGTKLVTGSRDGTWRIWSLASTAVIHTAEKLWTDVMGDFVFAPDGRSLVVTNDVGQLAILTTPYLARSGLITGAFQPILFEDNGRSLLALTKQNTLVRYNFEHQETQALGLKLTSNQKLASLESSSTFRTVAFGFDLGDLEVWDLARIDALKGTNYPARNIGALAWAPDRQELVVGDFTGLLSGKTFQNGHAASKWTDQTALISTLGFSNDGELLAVGRADGRIVLEKRGTGEVLQVLEGHSASIAALAFSPDGSRLVSGDAEGVMIFWSLTSLHQIAVWSWTDGLRTTAKPAIWRMKFDRSGNRLAAMTEDGRLRIWDGSK